MKFVAFTVLLLQESVAAFKASHLSLYSPCRATGQAQSDNLPFWRSAPKAHLVAARSSALQSSHQGRGRMGRPWDSDPYGRSEDLPWQGENLPGKEPPQRPPPFRDERVFPWDQGPPPHLESGSSPQSQRHVGLFREGSNPSHYDYREGLQNRGQDFYQPNSSSVKSRFPTTPGGQQSNLEEYRGPMGRGVDSENMTRRTGPNREPPNRNLPWEGALGPRPPGAPGRRRPTSSAQNEMNGPRGQDRFRVGGGNQYRPEPAHRMGSSASATTPEGYPKTTPTGGGNQRPSSGTSARVPNPSQIRPGVPYQPKKHPIDNRVDGGVSRKDLPRDEIFERLGHEFTMDHDPRPVPDNNLDGISRVLMNDLYSENEGEVVNALNNLASGCVDEKSRFRVFEAGGHTAVLRTMRKWFHSHAVQSVGCRTLQNMCLNNGVPKNIAANLGAFDVVCTAMENFPSSEIVQECGCGALLNLSYYESGADRLMTHSNAFFCLDRALRSFPGSRDLQYWAVSAIRNISRYEKHRQQLVDSGYLNMLLDIIEAYKDDEQIHDAAGSAMGRLLDLKGKE